MLWGLHDWHCKLGHPAEPVLNFAHWTDAMNNEMDALLRNDTWEITELPKDKKAIEGVDFEETFSTVVKMVTVRCLLNLVVLNCWPIFQLDVNNAFLYGDLVETVYMKPPEGYFPFGDNKVCILKKFLYGLKQAPMQWNAKLTSALIENSFRQSKSDYSLYTKSDKGVFVALLVYVDDIIITGNGILEIKKFKTFLKSKFIIKDLGKLKYFLGIEVVDTDMGIYLNQRKYVLDLLSEYGMLACKPAKTLLQSKLVITNEATIDDPLLDNITDYQKHSSLKSNLKTAFKILRYLKGYPGLGIHITICPYMTLKAYSNVDLAKCVVTRRALASVTSEVIWILKILKDLQCENLLPVSLYCDSNSTIKIDANPVFHERTKHLETDLHFIREKILNDVVKTVKVESANQIANILTKRLDTVQHKELVDKLGLLD
ncbi:ribonuclease H-like domain-containing protein [Tanacetum coccineum]